MNRPAPYTVKFFVEASAISEILPMSDNEAVYCYHKAFCTHIGLLGDKVLENLKPFFFIRCGNFNFIIKTLWPSSLGIQPISWCNPRQLVVQKLLRVSISVMSWEASLTSCSHLELWRGHSASISSMKIIEGLPELAWDVTSENTSR